MSVYLSVCLSVCLCCITLLTLFHLTSLIHQCTVLHLYNVNRYAPLHTYCEELVVVPKEPKVGQGAEAGREEDVYVD